MVKRVIKLTPGIRGIPSAVRNLLKTFRERVREWRARKVVTPDIARTGTRARRWGSVPLEPGIIGSAVRNLLKTFPERAGEWSARKVVTLDIDRTTIRLVETTGTRVRRWASAPLEPGIIEDGVVSKPPLLGQTVKQLMTSSGIKARKVIASIHGLYSISRILRVPNPPAGLVLSQAVVQAAKETLPLSADKVYLSWQIIHADGEGQEALVVGVPREVLDSEVRALRAVGISPHILELKAMALARVVNQKQALVLNIEPSSFDIVVVVNGMPEIMRTAPWQPEKLTVEDKAEHLAITLELTVGFYNSHYPDTPLKSATPLFLTGQMSGDLALLQKLQTRWGYPVEPLAPPLEYPAHLPLAQYAVNIGLALKPTAPAQSPGQSGYLPLTLNLLPEIYLPWRPSTKQIYTTAAVIAIIALLFPLFQATTGAMNKTADLQSKFTILNTGLQRRQLEIKNRLPLEMAVEEYQTIAKLGTGFSEDLKVINQEAGKLGIKVQSMDHKGKNITVTAEAKEGDYLTFRKYLTALAESGRFTTPIPPPEGFPYTWRGPIMLTPKPGK